MKNKLQFLIWESLFNVLDNTEPRLMGRDYTIFISIWSGYEFQNIEGIYNFREGEILGLVLPHDGDPIFSVSYFLYSRYVQR